MSVLPKERLGEVVPISFGAPQSQPEVSAWQVGARPAVAPSEPVRTEPAPPSPNASENPPARAPQEQRPMPVVSEEPPVFEISEDILRAFYEEAVAVGLEDGKAQVFSELTVLQERYASAVEKLRLVGNQLAAQNQTQVIQLSCLIAEKIIRAHLKLNPTDLLSMIEEAIRNQEEAGSVDVVCSSGDFEFLESRLAETGQAKSSLMSVNLKVDESFEYGDFRLETNIGAVDARVSDRVAQAQSVLGGGLDSV